MTSMVDISFIVPVYNASPWIEQCVESIRSQTRVAIEIICVDDGSTDDSVTLLTRLSEVDPRVRVISQGNAGQSVARNRGLDVASGRYVVFVDSDDFWVADRAADLVAAAEREELDVLLFDGHAVRDGDVSPTLWTWYATYYRRRGKYRRATTGIRLAARMRRQNDYKPHVGLYLTRTDYLRDAGPRFIPGIVHQDNPFTFRLLLGARRVGHLPHNVYARRVRPGSTITSLDAQRSVEGYLVAYADMRSALNATTTTARDRRALADIVQYALRGAVKRLPDLSPEAREHILETHRWLRPLVPTDDPRSQERLR